MEVKNSIDLFLVWECKPLSAIFFKSGSGVILEAIKPIKDAPFKYPLSSFYYPYIQHPRGELNRC
jgi:hypothetical protein